MSFQAYLDNIETKTGLTPRQFIELAHERGFDETTKSAPIVAWLKEDYGLGQGHAMALVHVITKGPQISTKHSAPTAPTATHPTPSGSTARRRTRTPERRRDHASAANASPCSSAGRSSYDPDRPECRKSSTTPRTTASSRNPTTCRLPRKR